MVRVCAGTVEVSVPKVIEDDEILTEAIIYGDIATFIMELPTLVEKYPRIRESVAMDVEILNSLIRLVHQLKEP